VRTAVADIGAAAQGKRVLLLLLLLLMLGGAALYGVALDWCAPLRWGSLFMIRTESVTVVSLRFYPFRRRFLS
jgi:hypothetical protein